MSKIKFKPFTNCPPGEYWSVFINSEVVKYPRGEREILHFLILKDKETPLLNNQGEAYYSVIVCNKSKGTSPKSKISKIKKAMLSKEEYDPIDCLIELPELTDFYKRKFKVLVEKKKDLTFITKIQRPRDNEWENIEGEFDGDKKVIDCNKKTINEFTKEYLIENFNQLKHHVNYKNRDDCYYFILSRFNENKDNKNTLISEEKITNKYNKNGEETARYSGYKKLLNFLNKPTKDNLNLLYPLG